MVILLALILLCIYLHKKEPTSPLQFMLLEEGIVGLMWIITLAVIK